MKSAVIVIDMLEDTFSEMHRNPVAPLAEAIVPNINRLTDIARSKNITVIFPWIVSCAAILFLKER